VRQTRRQFAGFCTGAGMISAAGTWAAVPEGAKLRVGVSMRHSMVHLPLLLADHLGYFRQAGVALDWNDFDAGSLAHQALQSGQIDIMSGAFEQVLDWNEQGHKLQAFVVQSRTPQISLGIGLRQLPSFHSMADLRRFRIGVSTLGSASHSMALVWCLQAGLNPGEIHILEVGNMISAMEALRTGTVDALCHMDPLMSWLELKRDLRVVADTRTVQSAQMWLGGAAVSSCLFAKADFLAHKPELIQGVTDGVVRALRWLLTAGPTDVLKTVPASAWMGDRAFYLATLDKVRDSFSPDGVFTDEMLQTAWRNRALRLGLPRIHATDRAALMAAFTNSAVTKNRKRSLA